METFKTLPTKEKLPPPSRVNQKPDFQGFNYIVRFSVNLSHITQCKQVFYLA